MTIDLHSLLTSAMLSSTQLCWLSLMGCCFALLTLAASGVDLEAPPSSPAPIHLLRGVVLALGLTYLAFHFLVSFLLGHPSTTFAVLATADIASVLVLGLLYRRTVDIQRRVRIRWATWLLTTALAVAFAVKVAALMSSWPMVCLAWLQPVAYVLGSLYLLLSGNESVDEAAAVPCSGALKIHRSSC